MAWACCDRPVEHKGYVSSSPTDQMMPVFIK